jgi:hypothetical protein
MNRAIGLACVWTLPLVFASCDGGYYDDRYNGGYYGNCRQFSSCESCTPMYGCGWCTYGNGQGVCLSDPDQCRTQQFTWTWEPIGCGLLGDGGTPKQDAGDASSATCHWPAAADTFAGSDAGPTGCQPSTGSDLCSASQYMESCYGASMPDASLSCTVVPIPTPSNVLFYCCPCAP